MTLDGAARLINAEGVAVMADAYEAMAGDADLYAKAARCLGDLPARDRMLLEEAFRSLGRFGGGLTPGEAMLLCRAGMAATRRAAAMDPEPGA
ncbi:hypothetical protein EMO91_12395 [Bifidobacterium myosotis]|uniref:Uncharacterized protein n=2 Tax=Bifidobacterium myosotis TaxID=1630166 RepID=A0A5M9ZHV4_9BIFI|nr:hypothetical protein EMO91_12395 [Bifidobacterium myosotis]